MARIRVEASSKRRVAACEPCPCRTPRLLAGLPAGSRFAEPFSSIARPLRSLDASASERPFLRPPPPTRRRDHELSSTWETRPWGCARTAPLRSSPVRSRNSYCKRRHRRRSATHSSVALAKSCQGAWNVPNNCGVRTSPAPATPSGNTVAIVAPSCTRASSPILRSPLPSTVAMHPFRIAALKPSANGGHLFDNREGSAFRAIDHRSSERLAWAVRRSGLATPT